MFSVQDATASHVMNLGRMRQCFVLFHQNLLPFFNIPLEQALSNISNKHDLIQRQQTTNDGKQATNEGSYYEERAQWHRF
jgi:hypothetical protein